MHSSLLLLLLLFLLLLLLMLHLLLHLLLHLNLLFSQFALALKGSEYVLCLNKLGIITRYTLLLHRLELLQGKISQRGSRSEDSIIRCSPSRMETPKGDKP